MKEKFTGKEKTSVVRIFGGAQWDNANRSTPLCLFICQTCPMTSTDDDERLDSEKGNGWLHLKVPGILKTVRLEKNFISAPDGSCFNSMTEVTTQN